VGLVGAMLRPSHSPGGRTLAVARHARNGRGAGRNGGALCECAARSVAMMDEHQNATQLLTSRPRICGPEHASRERPVATALRV
jgi:hypothetical protein